MKEKQLKNEELDQVTGGIIPITTCEEKNAEDDDLDIGGDPSTDKQAPIY